MSTVNTRIMAIPPIINMNRRAGLIDSIHINTKTPLFFTGDSVINGLSTLRTAGAARIIIVFKDGTRYVKEPRVIRTLGKLSKSLVNDIESLIGGFYIPRYGDNRYAA